MFAGDPAPQQLTAPCRKYQAACISQLSKRCTCEFPEFFGLFQALGPRFCEHDHSFRFRRITCGKRNLRAATVVVFRSLRGSDFAPVNFTVEGFQAPFE